MKIVFLDIDGVLCTERSCLSVPASLLGPMLPLDREAVRFLVRLCKESAQPVRVVISSSWRNQHSFGDLTAHLQRHGFEPALLHDDWRTVSFDDAERGEELAEWLSRHSEVDSFVILDDDSDFRPEQLPRLAQTSFAKGLLAAEFRAAFQILHGRPPASARRRRRRRR